MAYRKKTLRNMFTNSRKLARIINDLDSALIKLKNFLPTVESMELDSNALYNRLSTFEKKAFNDERATLLTESEDTSGAAPDPTAPAGPLFAMNESAGGYLPPPGAAHGPAQELTENRPTKEEKSQ